MPSARENFDSEKFVKENKIRLSLNTSCDHFQFWVNNHLDYIGTIVHRKYNFIFQSISKWEAPMSSGGVGDSDPVTRTWTWTWILVADSAGEDSGSIRLQHWHDLSQESRYTFWAIRMVHCGTCTKGNAWTCRVEWRTHQCRFLNIQGPETPSNTA